MDIERLMEMADEYATACLWHDKSADAAKEALRAALSDALNANKQEKAMTDETGNATAQAEGASNAAAHVSAWVATAERLPAHGESVLAYGAKRLEWAVLTFSDRDGWEVQTASDSHGSSPPKYWKPLPAPPTNAEGNHGGTVRASSEARPPREPTEAMLEAVRVVLPKLWGSTDDKARELWIRMWDASPSSAGQDAERLDWLDRDDVEMICTTRMGKPIVLFRRTKTGEFFAEGTTVRAAIDAARAALGGEK